MKWEPNDIALCIRKIESSRIFLTLPQPEIGRLYTVEEVYPDFIFDDEHVGCALLLKDGPFNYRLDENENIIEKARIWSAERFIKVTPPKTMRNDLTAEEKILLTAHKRNESEIDEYLKWLENIGWNNVRILS